MNFNWIAARAGELPILMLDDLWFIAEHRLSLDAGGYKLWATASDPYASVKAPIC